MKYARHGKLPVHLRSRLDKTYKKLAALKLDGLLISNQFNITYLTGFLSRDSYLLLSKPLNKQKSGFFITDFRYIEEARKNLKGFFIRKVEGSLFDLIGELATKLKLKKIGFEERNLSFAEYKIIKEKLACATTLIPTHELIESFRQLKTKNELKKIKRAIQINTQAFQYAKTLLKAGIRECDLANRLEYFVKEKGATSFSFDAIVASGLNSAFPHHMTSKRKLKKNEPLLIDMGVDFQGYKSDLTRIFFLGKITPVVKRTYDIILGAQTQAIKQIRPGVPVSKIDSIARQYIAQKGYGRFFGHNLGHGIGLEVHEDPQICAKNNQRLTQGMLFTIEPAVYLPGRFGIRIEDIVLVTRKGVKVLSGALDKSI